MFTFDWVAIGFTIVDCEVIGGCITELLAKLDVVYYKFNAERLLLTGYLLGSFVFIFKYAILNSFSLSLNRFYNSIILPSFIYSWLIKSESVALPFASLKFKLSISCLYRRSIFIFIFYKSFTAWSNSSGVHRSGWSGTVSFPYVKDSSVLELFLPISY